MIFSRLGVSSGSGELRAAHVLRLARFGLVDEHVSNRLHTPAKWKICYVHTYCKGNKIEKNIVLTCSETTRLMAGDGLFCDSPMRKGEGFGGIFS